MPAMRLSMKIPTSRLSTAKQPSYLRRRADGRHPGRCRSEAMADYGKHLGMAFQIVDDVLDYQGDVQSIGKNVGDDLAEGKMTLPLIYARDQVDAHQRAADLSGD